MAKKKVFISFDFDDNKGLKELMVGQGKNARTPWEVSDCSLKEAAPQAEWAIRAHRAIARSDVFIVMLGSKTAQASGVLKEVGMANELEKKRFQVIGYKDGKASWAVPGGGRTYKWTWSNIDKLVG